MKICLIVLLELACTLAVVAQDPGPSCCDLKIDSDQKPAGVVKVIVTNLDRPLIRVLQSLNGDDLEAEVTIGTGREAERTEYGKRRLKGIIGGSRLLRELKAREGFSEELDLRKLFELESGTTYIVTIRRNVLVDGYRVGLRAKGSVSMP